MKLNCLSLSWLAFSLVHSLPANDAFGLFGKRQASSDPFSSHKASKQLKWYSCYGSFQCARLAVPFDYSNPDGDTFSLALVKIPAEKKRKGALFLVDGVGDAAGVSFVTAPYFFPNGTQATSGQAFQSGGLEAYDVIGWDARGAGFTTPKLRCFKDENAAITFNYKGFQTVPALGLWNATYTESKFIVDNINDNRAYNREWIAGCQKYSSHMLPYMSTADNVRDLNHIFNLVKAQSGGQNIFWGYEYATYMGEMYAAMFPKTFDKMYLDGVVNAQNNLDHGDNYPSSVQDANKVLGAMFDQCAASHQCETPGGGNDFGNCCDIYETSSAAVQARYEAVKANLAKNAFVSKTSSDGCGGGPCTFTLADLRGSMFVALEFPSLPGLPFAPVLATAIYELEQGDILPGGGPGYFNSAIVTLITIGNGRPFDPYRPALQCLDQRNYIPSTAMFKPYLRQMVDTSFEAGGEVALSELACTDWNISPKHPFTDNFVLVRTTKDILFGSNTADPLTPLANGEMMEKTFVKSGLLTMNTVGFTSLVAGSSQCAAEYRAAFVTGTVSAGDKFCDDFTGEAFNVPLTKDYRS